MRRFTPTLLAALAGVGFAGSTTAGPIDTLNPRVVDEESIGQNTVVQFNLAPTAQSSLNDLEPVTLILRFFSVDAMDVVTTLIDVAVPSAAIDVDGDGVFGENPDDVLVYAAIGVTDIRFDVGAIPGVNLAFNAAQGSSAVSVGAQILADDASMNRDANVIDTTAGVPNEGPDEALSLVFDALAFSGAFINTDGDQLTVVFNRSLSNLDVGNDVNHTILANVDALDIEIADNSSFNMPAAPLGTTFPPTFVGGDNIALQFVLDPMTTNIDSGDFLRFVMGGDVRDFIGEDAGDLTAGAQVEALTGLEIDEAKFLERVSAGTVADAIRVTFNNPLDSGDIGDVAFWNNIFRDAGASDLLIDDVRIDPADANSVLLDVDMDGDDAVAADGTDEDTGEAFELQLDEMDGDPPSDIFGQDFTGTDTVSIDDCIAPARASGFTNAAFVDCDGDGTLDAIKIVFDEPLGATSANNTDGFTLMANSGVTVHPVAGIDLQTGARPGDANHPGISGLDADGDGDTGDDDDTTFLQADFDTAPPAGDEELALGTPELASTDVDGDGEISDREQNNSIVIKYDIDSVDWDGDGDLGGDDAFEALGSTGDFGLVNVDFDSDGTGIEDVNGTATADSFTVNSNVDCAAPVVLSVNFLTGDNIDSGQQKVAEQDGEVGDGGDNIAQIVATERLDAVAAVRSGSPGNLELGEFRFGAGANDNFDGGTALFVGNDENVLQISDDDENGWSADDSLTIRPGSRLSDSPGNLFPGTDSPLPAVDRTAPFIGLINDFSGNGVISAFLIDSDADDFVERIDMFFNAPVDAATVMDGDFTVAGINADVPTTVSADGFVISLNVDAVAADTLPISDPVEVTYNPGGNTVDTPLAGLDGNAVADGCETSFDADQVPEPNVDADFTAIKVISGVITDADGTPVPAGTKVFGMVAAPIAKSIRGTMNSVSFVLTDNSSLHAVTNVILGLEEFAYMFIDSNGTLMFIRNDKNIDENVDAILQLNINSTNLQRVTYTGRGFTDSFGNATISGGTIEVSWGLLASDSGTAVSLWDEGIGGAPITSAAVIGDDTGAYVLKMSAPIAAFNGMPKLNAINWPVIVVVELANGKRFAVSSLVDRLGGGGPISFAPNNRNDDTDGSAPGDCVFDIDLQNIGITGMYNGWNLVKFARASGFASASNQLPLLPRGVTEDDVALGSDFDNRNLPLRGALAQFVYFEDDNSDGMYTADDDDDDSFDRLIVDPRCLEHFAFVMTSRGVQVNKAFKGRFASGITTLTGGYGLGFFNADNGRIGIFQGGAPISAGPVLTDSGDLNANLTFGWILGSYVPASSEGDSVADFFTTNGPDNDFFIIFNRTGNNRVEVETGSGVSDGSTTASEVGCLALFLHYNN